MQNLDSRVEHSLIPVVARWAAQQLNKISPPTSMRCNVVSRVTPNSSDTRPIESISARLDLSVALIASAAFVDSGFTLSALNQIDSPATPGTTYQSAPLIDLDLDGADTERYERILETMGEFASAQRLRLVIEAPAAIEIDLLLPVLMGRDHAISVLFLPIEENSIRLRMYPESLAAAQ